MCNIHISDLDIQWGTDTFSCLEWEHCPKKWLCKIKSKENIRDSITANHEADLELQYNLIIILFRLTWFSNLLCKIGWRLLGAPEGAELILQTPNGTVAGNLLSLQCCCLLNTYCVPSPKGSVCHPTDSIVSLLTALYSPHFTDEDI